LEDTPEQKVEKTEDTQKKEDAKTIKEGKEEEQTPPPTGTPLGKGREEKTSHKKKEIDVKEEKTENLPKNEDLEEITKIDDSGKEGKDIPDWLK
jgi:hypothetical protein